MRKMDMDTVLYAIVNDLTFVTLSRSQPNVRVKTAKKNSMIQRRAAPPISRIKAIDDNGQFSLGLICADAES